MNDCQQQYITQEQLRHAINCVSLDTRANLADFEIAAALWGRMHGEQTSLPDTSSIDVGRHLPAASEAEPVATSYEIQRLPAVRQALMAYHARPADEEACAIVRAILDASPTIRNSRIVGDGEPMAIYREALERIADKQNIHCSGDAQVIAQIALKAASDAEPHPPTRHCMCADCAPSFEADDTYDTYRMAQDDRATFAARTVRKLWDLKEHYRLRAGNGEAGVLLPVPFAIDTSHKNQAFVTLGFNSSEDRIAFVEATRRNGTRVVRAAPPEKQSSHSGGDAGGAVELPDDAYQALQCVEETLAAIANRQKVVGDTIERIDSIAAASKRAKYALGRLQAVAHHFDAAPTDPHALTVAQGDAERYRQFDQALTERDHAEDMADKLAEAIGKHFGVDVGEHSNLHCPWQEALDVIAEPAQDGERAIWQSWKDGAGYGYWDTREEAELNSAPDFEPVLFVPAGQQGGGDAEAQDAGIEAAAAWIDARRDAFDNANGYGDPTTGAWEYGTGEHAEAKREYSGELAEIAEGIRALKSSCASAPRAGKESPDA